MRWFGKLSLTLSAILSFGGAASAQAADSTLNYNAFLNSPGYQILAAEYASTTTYLSNQTGVQINSVSIATVEGAEQSHTEIERLSTSAASSVTVTAFQGGSPLGQPWGSAYANGYVYVPIATVMVRPDLKNGEAAISRLKATAAVTARMTSAVAGSEFVPYSPAEIMGGSTIDPLAWLNDNTEGSDLTSVIGLSFSEVASSQDADNPALTNYSFVANLPGTSQVPARTANFVVRFNASHVFESQTITVTSGQITVLDTTTLAIASQATMPTTWTQNAVDWPTLLAMGKRISAEKSLAGKAKALASKAMALARAAKKPVTGAFVVAAAKALKYAAAAVKNGAKLTAKYQGQAGSVCVTAVKGKTLTANC